MTCVSENEFWGGVLVSVETSSCSSSMEIPMGVDLMLFSGSSLPLSRN